MLKEVTVPISRAVIPAGNGRRGGATAIEQKNSWFRVPKHSVKATVDRFGEVREGSAASENARTHVRRGWHLMWMSQLQGRGRQDSSRSMDERRREVRRVVLHVADELWMTMAQLGDGPHPRGNRSPARSDTAGLGMSQGMAGYGWECSPLSNVMR